MSAEWRDILEAVGWPTEIVVLDFETFFDQDYTLKDKKRSTIEYIMNERFEEHGVAVLYMSGKTPYAPLQPSFDHDVAGALQYLQFRYGKNLEGCTVVMQHARFDASILAFRHDLHPTFIVDTRDLACHLEARGKHSLEYLAESLGLEPKGDTLQFSGLHWDQKIEQQPGSPPRRLWPGMTDQQKADLAGYAKHDAVLEFQVFARLLPRLTRPDVELRLMLHTLRLFTQPRLRVDVPRAEELIVGMRQKLDEALAAVEVTRKVVNSGEPFIKLLREALDPDSQLPILQQEREALLLIVTAGSMEDPTSYYPPAPASALARWDRVNCELAKHTPPLKRNKAGKMILAAAKGDAGREFLLNHPTERVRLLMQARVASKSWPLHWQRVERLRNQATAIGGVLPIPLGYHGAHTGRWAGEEKINPQNLGARSEYDLINEVRTIITAPEGYVLVISDASQIEARMVNWQAGQWDMIEAFAIGAPIYCRFASAVLGKPIRKVRSTDPPVVAAYLKHWRQMGKVGVLGCVARNTPVLTDSGWRAIQHISPHDRVWDGTAFVRHRGRVCRGRRPCMEVNGVWVTPDHEILGENGWFPAAHRHTNNPVLASAMGNSQWSRLYSDHEAGLSVSNVVAPAVEQLIRTETTWWPESLHAVMYVLKRHLRLPTSGTVLWMNRIGRDFLAAFVRSLVAAKHNPILDMGAEASAFTRSGSRTEWLFFDTLLRFPVGAIRTWKSIESITTETTHPETCDLPPEVKICETWDIMRAGSNRRYQTGPLLVANCGYGMGPTKAQSMAKTQYRIDLTFGMTERLVKYYRNQHPQVVKLWYEVERAFKVVTRYPSETADLDRGLHFFRDDRTTVIRLPSGRELRYAKAGVYGSGRDEEIRMPDPRKPGTFIRMWGGYLVENIVQATSRDILAEGMLAFDAWGHPKYDARVALHVHDEIIAVVPREHGPAALEKMNACLSTRPAWAPEVPLAAEGRITGRYGK